MTNDALVAFMCGGCCGIVFGIFLSAVFVAIGNKIEGRDDR